MFAESANISPRIPRSANSPGTPVTNGSPSARATYSPNVMAIAALSHPTASRGAVATAKASVTPFSARQSTYKQYAARPPATPVPDQRAPSSSRTSVPQKGGPSTARTSPSVSTSRRASTSSSAAVRIRASASSCRRAALARATALASSSAAAAGRSPSLPSPLLPPSLTPGVPSANRPARPLLLLIPAAPTPPSVAERCAGVTASVGGASASASGSASASASVPASAASDANSVRAASSIG
mmetsp:Transcript_24414/g.92211  ORF Transcript_24414/g.92211 Transcript_24414/m.92211 type:complete len:242 (-) Transcript_24414:288-1013(-)